MKHYYLAGLAVDTVVIELMLFPFDNFFEFVRIPCTIPVGVRSPAEVFVLTAEIGILLLSL